MLGFRRLTAVIIALAQLTACAPGQGQFELPGVGQLQIPQLPSSLPSIPGLSGTGQIPSIQQLSGSAQQLVMQALYTQIGHVLGDDLPIKLDASTAFPAVSPPADFNPTPIDCTPDNMNMSLVPGDYTCQVRLYCMRDSIHRPGSGTPYEFGPLEGKQADAIGALLANGTLAGIAPETLQTISWEIQASIPLSEMPPQHQQIVQQLIPEYANDLNGNFLQGIEETYSKFQSVPGVPPLNTLLAQMGEPGEAILDILRSREIIQQNALDYERLDEEVYDGPPGQQTLPPVEGQPSPWSQIRPGVVAQLVVQQGNLGLNTLNFRVLSNAGGAASNEPDPKVIDVVFRPGGASELAQAEAIPVGITLVTLFWGVATTTYGVGRALKPAHPVIAYPKAESQAMTMVMNSDKSKDDGYLYHYTWAGGYLGIMRTHIIQESADGYVYLTPQIFLRGRDAQNALSLTRTPIGYFAIPIEDIGPIGSATRVLEDDQGHNGGGLEIKIPHPVSTQNAKWLTIPP